MNKINTLYKFKNRATDDEIVENIEDGLNLDISNFAILICAILIASVGLNMNSVAVIIGAMLISPLMGAIIGIGYGIGTYNEAYIKRSFIIFIIEIIVSLVTATVYFSLTPITGATSEMLARTTPTIFDVIIAFVGGTAGMIGLSRERPGNVLPGVAIATALMPPLCTAGYGIATLNLKIFLGAGYLFLINSFFIAISTFLVVKALKLPKKVFLNKEREKKIKGLIIVLSIIVIIPSIVSAGTMVAKSIEEHNLTSFINDEISQNSYVLNKSINQQKKEIDLVVVGNRITDGDIKALDSKLQNYGFSGYTLKVTQDQDINIGSYLNNMKNKDGQMVKDVILENNENKDFQNVGKELKSLYPEISDVVIGEGQNTLSSENTDKILLVYIKDKEPEKLNKTNLENYLKTATGYSNIILKIN
ncbi:MAG: DUF389 domain-containing protein [Clostridium sp.]|uniref:DUF389 domain-containing protein n=1 Tax=Clostridium sp. TaxID=1506 RepID=UPI003EE6AB65